MLACFLLRAIVGRGGYDQGAKMVVTLTITSLFFFFLTVAVRFLTPMLIHVASASFLSFQPQFVEGNGYRSEEATPLCCFYLDFVIAVTLAAAFLIPKFDSFV